MSNLFDYVAWRGDLTFGNASLCPADALVFSMIAYMNFEGLVPRDPREEPVRLADVAKAYFARPRGERTFFDTNHEKLLLLLADSARFGPLRIFAADTVLDRSTGTQFAAISFLLPGQNLFVAFRGTDDTLVGWKEDFRMSYECPVPAQLEAKRYLSAVAGVHPLRLFLWAVTPRAEIWRFLHPSMQGKRCAPASAPCLITTAPDFLTAPWQARRMLKCAPALKRICPNPQLWRCFLSTM